MTKRPQKKERNALYVKLPDPSLKTRLAEAARKMDRSVAYLVRQAAEEKLERLATEQAA